MIEYDLGFGYFERRKVVCKMMLITVHNTKILFDRVQANYA
jgi:hypothetical protein